MHQLLPLRMKIWVIVGIAAVVSATTRWLGFHALSLGSIVGIIEFMIIYLLFHSWSWLHHVSWCLPAWMRVDLSGEWSGTIRSQYKERPDELDHPPISVRLHLRQSWQEIVFTLETDKMRSRSFNTMPTFDRQTQDMCFRYFFATEPTAAVSGINPPQILGCAVAHINLKQPNCMKIIYTNERGRGGDIALVRNQ